MILLEPFQLLIKPVSGRCNQKCSYCFYRDVPDRVYGNATAPTMSDDLLSTLLESYLSLGLESNIFTWQGGEPTLAGLDFYKSVVAGQHRYGQKGQVIGNALQTNGSLIDEDWAEFLSHNRFLVGLSIDGPEAIHDAARGDGTWRKAMHAAELLREHNVALNTLTVVHRGNADHAQEIYSFLRRHGFTHLQFIPAVDRERNGTGLLQHSVTPEQYGSFLCSLFDAWRNRGDVGTVALRLFEAVIENALQRESVSLCSLSPTCGRYLVVEHNGDVFPCDFFVNREQQPGNITENTWSELLDRRRAFEEMKADYSDTCASCEWLGLCHGGCPKNRIGGKRTRLCVGYQQFFEHINGWLDEVTSRLRRTA